MVKIIKLFVIVVIGGVPPLSAQAPTTDLTHENRRILAAVAEHVRSGIVESGALDPGFRMMVDVAVATDKVVPTAAGSRGTWTPEDVRKVADSIGSTVGDPRAYRTCETGMPGHCRLRGVDAILTFGVPSINGDRATVTVRVLHRSEAAPDPYQSFRTGAVLVLEKRHDRWAVTGTERTSVS